ncbi:hypothetical protein F5Y14DRAFT_402233 [Nemania sp. NC0429]|nr:hypothetical protein F5Y14DRAFT_402233 [Nemania sp. NC0429]
MASMACTSSSDDEFPDVAVIVQRNKGTIRGEAVGDDSESAPRKPGSSKSAAPTTLPDSTAKTRAATTRRRRKLGQSQPVDGSLMKPWDRVEVEEESGSSRQMSRTRSERQEAGTAMAGELLDRLPVKAKHAAKARVVPSGTMFDSPPKEQRRTRRLISRAERDALRKKVTDEANDGMESSDGSGSVAEDYGNDDITVPSDDEESDFILRGDSDSDDLSMTPPQRSQSPCGPRRLQRRALSSPRDPSKKEPAWAKPTQDDSIASPKKRAERRNVPTASTTRRSKAAPKADLEEVFEKLKIFDEESEPDEPAARKTSARIPEPMTPKKNLTASPAKVPRIPMSPWKPEHKEFWDPEVNFAWIDKHSPPKKSAKKTMPDLTAPDHKAELKRRYGTSPEKKQAKKAFDSVKEDLARDFLLELDDVITNGKLAQLTEATGGLRIVWSNTLLTTAGRAHWKCKTTTTTSKLPPSASSSSTSATTTATATTATGPTITKTTATGPTITKTTATGPTITKTTATQHHASIELAHKVLSNEADLLNTVAHEFCHLAVFLLHGKPKLAHGAEFKMYGQRVMDAATAAAATAASKGRDKGKSAPSPPLRTPAARGVEISVTTRHSYEIEYRFVWRCADCGAEVCRHSRSVDPARQRCGRCKGGVLVQVKPVPRGGGASKGGGNGDAGESSGRDAGTGTGTTTGTGGAVKGQQQKTEKKKTAYQEFTSREMKALSVSHKGLSFKEKMVMVSARWSEHQRLVKTKTAGTDGGDGGVATAIATVSIRGLTAAAGMLGIEDDKDDEGGAGVSREGKAAAAVAYDIFA